MTGDGYVLSAVLVIALVTFALRGLIFVALRRVSETGIVRYLGAVMPGGVMLVLVFYTVSSVTFTKCPYGLPSVAGIVSTAAVYHWRRNPLLAIVAGTSVYLALQHIMG